MDANEYFFYQARFDALMRQREKAIGWLVMGKRRKSGNLGPQPDDYFAAGPIELARFGKMMVARSRATPEQFATAQKRMVEMLPGIIAEIDDLVREIAEQIAALSAGRLLHYAYWAFSATALTKGTSAVESEGLLRMLDYVQSVIASVLPAPNQSKDISEEDWQKLHANVQALFHKITMDYQFSLTAARRASDPELDMELEEFRYRAECMWMHVRGKRYQPHEKIALAELLEPHSDVLQNLFGLGASELADEFDKILRKLSGGAALSTLAAKQFHEDSIPRMEAIFENGEATTIEEVMHKLFEDTEFAARRDAVMGEFAGYNLFDVAKVTQLPAKLIDALTWEPGGDTEFMETGEFAGWPLRIWPTMKRPFIRIDGRAMCFEMWSLFDNIYRALQRIILSLDPSYKDGWNSGQKQASELIPFKYFDILLPGNTAFSSVTYRWKPAAGKAQWCECDGLVIYDDHLFVLEVKAGAFTYTSPATDLQAQLASLHNLIEAPAAQGGRFVDYLESAPEVTVHDGRRNEVGKLRRADFRHVTIVALSLDSFTELAARVQHLAKVGLQLGSQAVWALSIDDLRVYADLFNNPLIFLHFIEQRMGAVKDDRIDLDDEIDHLGLYLAQNNYGLHARELVGKQNAKLRFDGYRGPIDEYYSAFINNEAPTPPQQEMPDRLREIFDFLAASHKSGRVRLASHLLDGGGEFRQMLVEGIANQLDGNKRLRRQRPFLVVGSEPLTVCTWSPFVARNEGEALEYTRGVVASNDGQARLLVELEYGAADELIDVHWQHVSLDKLCKEDLARVRAIGEAGKQRRLTLAREKRKIGVNEQCPCGSGKKYKRCCRP